MPDNLSYLGVTPHLKNLRFCGFYQLDTNSSKMGRILHTAYMRFILFLILLYTFQQIIKVYQVSTFLPLDWNYSFDIFFSSVASMYSFNFGEGMSNMYVRLRYHVSAVDAQEFIG